MARGDIITSGNNKWNEVVFPTPPDIVLARIDKKMRVDEETGEVVWKEGEEPNKRSSDGQVGYLRPDGYRVTQIGKNLIPVSRIAFYLHYGTWPRGVIRFVNGDPSDFSKDNLNDALDETLGDINVAKAKYEETSQKERQELWFWTSAMTQAEEVLRIFGHPALYKAELTKERQRIKEFNAQSTTKIMGNVIPEDQIEAEAERRVRSTQRHEELEWAIPFRICSGTAQRIGFHLQRSDLRILNYRACPVYGTPAKRCKRHGLLREPRASSHENNNQQNRSPSDSVSIDKHFFSLEKHGADFSPH